MIHLMYLQLGHSKNDVGGGQHRLPREQKACGS